MALAPSNKIMSKRKGLLRELNPGPLAPEARIIPLDQAAIVRVALLRMCYDCGLRIFEGSPSSCGTHGTPALLYFVPLTCVRAHPDLNQGPADLQSAALTTELCTQMSITAMESAAPLTKFQNCSFSRKASCGIRTHDLPLTERCSAN